MSGKIEHVCHPPTVYQDHLGRDYISGWKRTYLADGADWRCRCGQHWEWNLRWSRWDEGRMSEAGPR